MPKWMAGIDTLQPFKALGLGLLLTGVNPKNLSTLGVVAGSLGGGIGRVRQRWGLLERNRDVLPAI